MANYLLVYHGGSMPETDAQRQQVMAAWGAWMGSLGNGLKDGGNPVGHTRTISGSGAVSEGGGSNPATGYSIISADNLDAAVALAKGCPVLTGGASIEVCETFDVM